jgi:hypothetical protein
VKRHGNEKLNLVGKPAGLQCAVGQKAQNKIELRSAVKLEAKYHPLQALGIEAGSGYLVEVYLAALAIGTGAFE